MITAKKIVHMAKKWRKIAALQSKRIPFPRNGSFAIYTVDQRRFVVPLAYLENSIFRQLLKMSEEEYGLPSDGPIVLPCDSLFMDYAICLIRQGRGLDHFQEASRSPCSLSRLYEGQMNHHTSEVVAEKGHFIVYTADKVRFSFPIAYLDSLIFRELLRISEEEFGLMSDGPIILACDSQLMVYISSLMERNAAKEVEKALLLSMAAFRCSSSYYYLDHHQTSQYNPLCGC
ncbi:hypothetical protein MIMGU_mgv1a026660mg [Erythranthe guttata]|uniref:Uncharacterized protein n=1 Tax=Erythranthe guttata TaxID=4155 RepID=A0A022RAR1_ERYGU|nr:hypothetical protein MIMGU_mgv1a026660mg [Erythranthe guttata]